MTRTIGSSVLGLATVALAPILLSVVSLCASDEPHSVSPDTLPILVPERLELGPRVGEFEVDWDASAFVTLDQAVQASFDPAEDRQDLEDFGWVATYIRSFTPSGEHEGGLYSLAVGLALFDDDTGASSRVVDQRSDVFDRRGQDNGRWAVIGAEPFAFDSLGSNAGGATVELGNPSTNSSSHGTLLWFSQGQIAVSISIGSTDGTDYTEEAHSLALTISGMIEVITGAA